MEENHPTRRDLLLLLLQLKAEERLRVFWPFSEVAETEENRPARKHLLLLLLQPKAEERLHEGLLSRKGAARLESRGEVVALAASALFAACKRICACLRGSLNGERETRA